MNWLWEGWLDDAQLELQCQFPTEPFRLAYLPVLFLLKVFKAAYKEDSFIYFKSATEENCTAYRSA